MRKLNRKAQGFTLIELMIVVAIIGILAAIAIPNFIKFQARSKQSEPKANLKGLFTAQKSYFNEKDSYSTAIGLIGFSPERGNRYAYYVDSTGIQQPRSASTFGTPAVWTGVTVDTFKFPKQPDGTTDTVASPAVAVPGGAPGKTAGVSGLYKDATDNKTHFTHWAVGNIDNDVTPTSGLDQWFISSQSKEITPSDCTGTKENSAEGVPANTNNDVNCD